MVPSREGGDKRFVKSTPPAEPAEAASPGGDGGSFISRWSRLKTEARERPLDKPGQTQSPADAKAPAPELPAPESLTFDSDYRQFFHPRVGEDVRRTALKKLFSDPHFNAMDGLDVYIDDYSKTEPIPAAMLAGLRQAQNILRWAKEDAEERQRVEAGAENAPQNAGTRQEALEPPQAQPDAAGVANAKTSEPPSVSPTDGSETHS